MGVNLTTYKSWDDFHLYKLQVKLWFTPYKWPFKKSRFACSLGGYFIHPPSTTFPMKASAPRLWEDPRCPPRPSTQNEKGPLVVRSWVNIIPQNARGLVFFKQKSKGQFQEIVFYRKILAPMLECVFFLRMDILCKLKNVYTCLGAAKTYVFRRLHTHLLFTYRYRYRYTYTHISILRNLYIYTYTYISMLRNLYIYTYTHLCPNSAIQCPPVFLLLYFHSATEA